MPYANREDYNRARRRWRAQRARHSSVANAAVAYPPESRQAEPMVMPPATAQEPYQPILRDFDGQVWDGIPLHEPIAYRAPIDLEAMGVPSAAALTNGLFLTVAAIALGAVLLFKLLSKGASDSLGSCREAIGESVYIHEWIPKARL